MSAGAKQIEMVSPQRLTAHPRNVREHSDSQIDRIAKSITALGFTAPVIVNEEYVILAGHGRTQAAIKLGLDKIPVRMLTGLTDEEQRAVLISDNRLTDTSFFALPELKAELLDLDTGAIDLTITGFSQAELADLLGTSKSAPKDKDEEEPDLPTARIGDVWKLGESYLVVGKASRQEALAVCQSADMAIKGWQKASKLKAALHASGSNIVDDVIAAESMGL